MLTYILLILGFILLIKGADLFVDGSSSIARLLRIPAAVIGLTLLPSVQVPQNYPSAVQLPGRSE